MRHRRDPASPSVDLLPGSLPRAVRSAPTRPRGPRRAPGPAWTVRGLRVVGTYCLVLAVLGAAMTVWPWLSPDVAGARVLGPAAPGRAVDRAPVVPPSPSGGGPDDVPVDSTRVPQAQVGSDAGQPAAFRPARLALPSGRSAQVLSSGVHEDGSMVIPENPSQVGWWDGGALAGEPFGSVVVAGHVDSKRYGVGFMAEMRRLREGDVVVLSAGSGAAARAVRYRVDTLVQVDKARLAADADPFRQDTSHRLVLITCGGAYDHVAHRYPDNLVATATPVG